MKKEQLDLEIKRIIVDYEHPLFEYFDDLDSFGIFRNFEVYRQIEFIEVFVSNFVNKFVGEMTVKLKMDEDFVTETLLEITSLRIPYIRKERELSEKDIDKIWTRLLTTVKIILTAREGLGAALENLWKEKNQK